MIKRRLRDDLVVEAWHQLNANVLGAAELKSIRSTLAKDFDERAIPGPAALARTLAEHGVPLRHAEVLSVDSDWRTRQLNELFFPGELNFTSVQSSVESMEKLDDLLVVFNSEGDEVGEAHLRALVLELKSELESSAKARISVHEQKIAAEVVEWLTIWLQTAHIFADWLEIRRGSEAFRQRFDQSTDSTDYTEPK